MPPRTLRSSQSMTISPLPGRRLASVSTCSCVMAPSPSTTSSVIHIPAAEFPTSHAPPPSQPRPKLYSPDRARRRLDADHHRAAALRSMAHRCRAHVRHAANVATTVKAKRLADAQIRHRALAKTLAHANIRRLQHLSRRVLSSPQRTENLQRQRRELNTKYQSRHIGRLKARERRTRILSERKERAARFSPSRNNPLSDSSSSVSFDSLISRTLQFDDDFAPHDAPFLSCVQHTPGPTREATAATIIVSYYLLSRARRALTAAGALGPRVASSDFATLTTRLETQSTQDAAELVFRALGLRECARRTAAHEAAERRILLSCLVIALHPEAVLEHRDNNRNKQETVTLYCARRMLLCLQVGTVSAVGQAWLRWKAAFTAWKKHDAETMLRAMVEDAVATESLRVAVNKGFLQSENVRVFRRALGGEDEDEESGRKEHAAWEEGIARKQHLLRKGIVKLAGNAGERQLNVALSASRHAHNERMVHEILVDLPALLEDIRNPLPIPEEVWDKLRAELSEDPPVRDELASRLADISTTLNAMMPESFELEAVESPIELDVDFAGNVVCKATEALKKSQAEAFDDPLHEWRENAVLRLRNAHDQFVQVVVDVLKELTKLIRRSHTYVLLYRVRHSVPVVQQYGAAWERAHFQGHIASGKFSMKLPRTRRLFRQVLQTLRRDEASVRDDIQTAEAGTVRLMLTKAIATLASEMNMRSAEEVPELFYLDLERIVKMQNDVQRCALAGSLDNIGRQFLLSRRISVLSKIRSDLLAETERASTTLQDIEDSFLKWMSKVLGENGKSLSDSDARLLRRMVHRTVQPGDKTFDIIFKRVTEAIVEVAKTMASDRVRCSSSSAARTECKHNKKGLEGVNELIDDVANRVCCLVLHVLSVHGESVREVIRSL